MTTDHDQPPAMSGAFKVGDWLVNPELDEISRDGKVNKLEPRMKFLAAHHERGVRTHSNTALKNAATPRIPKNHNIES